MGCGDGCMGGSGSGSGSAPAPVSGGPATQAAFGPAAGNPVAGGSFNGGATRSSANGPTGQDFGSLCGSTNTVIPYTQNYTDPLGPNQSGNMAPTGGPEMRAGVYSTVQSLFPELETNTQQSTNALKTAAANPGYADAAALASKEINGGFLNGSPQLDTAVNQMRGAATRTAADNAARSASTYARNGMSFGTPQQEAVQADQAAGISSANNTEAQMRMQNYQTERANQDSATARLDNATGSPVNYLSQVNAAELSPLSSIAQIIQGLSGGGSTSYQPQDVVNNKGAAGQLSSDIGSL